MSDLRRIDPRGVGGQWRRACCCLCRSCPLPLHVPLGRESEGGENEGSVGFGVEEGVSLVCCRVSEVEFRVGSIFFFAFTGAAVASGSEVSSGQVREESELGESEGSVRFGVEEGTSSAHDLFAKQGRKKTL